MNEPTHWHCPHCQDGPRRFLASMEHIESKHQDCLMCGAEWMLLRAFHERRADRWYTVVDHGDFGSAKA